MIDVDAGDLPSGGAAKLVEIRGDASFYRLLKRGLEFSREAIAGKRPLKDAKYNAVQIFSAGSPVVDGVVPAGMGPIIFEVELGGAVAT